MAKKYYAVQKGRVPGVYLTWAACQQQVTGFSGAVFKSFPVRADAEAFAGLGGSNIGAKLPAASAGSSSKASAQASAKTLSKASLGALSEEPDLSGYEVSAYIDGSFDKRLGVVGYGGVIFFAGQKIPFSAGTADKLYTEYWNVAGELLAAMTVLDFARRKGARTCLLCYDYMGIEMWAAGQWKANNPLTQEYAAFAAKIMTIVTVYFHKVAAHTGVAYNEMADRLAKEGLTKAGQKLILPE